jgi:hypothetical protein
VESELGYCSTEIATQMTQLTQLCRNSGVACCPPIGVPAERLLDVWHTGSRLNSGVCQLA